MRMCLKSLLAVNNRIEKLIIEIPYYFFNWDIRYSAYYYRVFPIIADENVMGEVEVEEGEVAEYRLFERLFRDRIQRNSHVYTTRRSKRLEVVNESTQKELCKQIKEISHVWTKHFNVIEKHVKMFEDMIAEVKTSNDKVEIDIIVMPQNPTFIEKNKNAIMQMKEIFYNYLMPICEKYRIAYHDYFEVYLEHEEYFYDICHLNSKGRTMFSKLIAEQVLKEV